MIAHPDRNVNATILLASASPRRRELIKLLGLPVETTTADIDEAPLPGERAADMAMRLSREKAQTVLSALSTQQSAFSIQDSDLIPHPSSLILHPSSFIPHPSSFIIVLASDTVVSLDGEPLGKPWNAEEARSMLRRLRDRTHQVYTAITLIGTRSATVHSASGFSTITDIAASDVRMRDYSDEEIETYITSGDPFDKAGAYAIQNNGFHPVEHFAHCFANVMGLPLCHVARSLRKLGIEPPEQVPAKCQQHIQYQCPVFEKILTMSDEQPGQFPRDSSFVTHQGLRILLFTLAL